MKVIENFAWILSDKILRIVSGVFIGALVARHLGPEKFGIYNLGITISVFGATFAKFGLDSIIVRDLTAGEYASNVIASTVFFLRTTIGIGAWISISILLFTFSQNALLINVILIICSAIIFSGFEVYDLIAQAESNAIKFIRFRILSNFVAAIGRLTFVLLALSVIAFAITQLIEAAIYATLVLYALTNRKAIEFRYFSLRLAIDYIKQGLPLFLSVLAYLIYSRIDQFYIMKFMGSDNLGIYSASLRIVEFVSLPVIPLVTALFPSMVVNHKRSEIELNRYFKVTTSISTYIGIAITLTLFFFSRQIVHYLYGPEFAQSEGILIIQILAIPFLFNGALRSAYLTILGKQKMLLVTTVISSLISLALSYTLIVLFGLKGAAISSLIVQMCSLFGLNFMFNSLRPIGSLQLAALNPILLFKYKIMLQQ